MSNPPMPEPPQSLLNLIADLYAEGDGFEEDDFDNGSLEAQFIPKAGVQALATPVAVDVGMKLGTRPSAVAVNPNIGAMLTLAIFIPFIKRADNWLTTTKIEAETKRTLQAIGAVFNKPGIGLLEEPEPAPQPEPKRLPVRQKKRQKHKESRIRIYGYSRRLSGANTIRPTSAPT